LEGEGMKLLRPSDDSPGPFARVFAGLSILAAILVACLIMVNHLKLDTSMVLCEITSYKFSHMEKEKAIYKLEYTWKKYQSKWMCKDIPASPEKLANHDTIFMNTILKEGAVDAIDFELRK
jgi:hypothetical protein